MGNGWGNVPLNGIEHYMHPETKPSPLEQPTFDPQLGFKNPRKPREMKVTKEEMVSAKIPLKHRDYCAHMLLAFKECRRANFPFVVKCEHEKHAYLNCKYDDYIIRAKEYEREHRLRIKAEKCRQERAAATVEG